MKACLFRAELSDADISMLHIRPGSTSGGSDLSSRADRVSLIVTDQAT